MTKVKICGINSEAAFDAVAEAGADYLGFVFFEKSPRFVTPARAAALSGRLAGGPLRVGLFVQPAPEAIRAVLDRIPLDFLQIYGSPQSCREIAERSGVPSWRAVGVADRAELPAQAAGEAGFVIEAKPPPGASRPGGNAVAMDWRQLAGWRAPLPWLLGGGLNAGNVAQAIAVSGAPGVDTSSGVEAAPGEKSPALIRAFITAIRNADESEE